MEVRVNDLEKNMAFIRDSLSELQKQIDANMDRQIEALDQEKQTRARSDQQISNKLEVAQVSGLHVSMMGVVWLVVGVIMSTSSIELACLLQHANCSHWAPRTVEPPASWQWPP
jgi:hypothetical protein